MNYYEHHIGDYLRDTAHLSMLEDAAYRRLLDRYYTSEQPLPAEVRECCKLARAQTKPERDAVAAVLREFFSLADDGWRQKRADEEIARFQDKRGKAKASANSRWSHSERNANASPNAMRTHMPTHSERNANDMLHAGAPGHGRPPVPSPQTPDPIPKDQARASDPSPPRARLSEAEPAEVNGHVPTPAGEACIAIRRAGIAAVNPGHPDLLRLLEAGVTPQLLADTAAELVGKGKGKFPLLLATVEGRLRDAAEADAVPAPLADPLSWRKTWAGVEDKAAELGVVLQPNEMAEAFERRVLTAFQRRSQPHGAAA